MNDTVRDITRETFDAAARLRAKADRLPRWRWLKRMNLRDKAWSLEQAATLFWNAHKE